MGGSLFGFGCTGYTGCMFPRSLYLRYPCVFLPLLFRPNFFPLPAFPLQLKARGSPGKPMF